MAAARKPSRSVGKPVSKGIGKPVSKRVTNPLRESTPQNNRAPLSYFKTSSRKAK